MKNLFYYSSVIALGALLFQSCGSIMRAPKFVSSENVVDLKVNSTLDDVIAKLGRKPYNVFSSQKDGYTIYIYKYKILERKESRDRINVPGGEWSGDEAYNPAENTLYLIFKDNLMESFVTSSGRKDSPSLVLLNNTLYTISQDKGKYSIIPTTIGDEDPGKGGFAIPSLPVGGPKK